MAKQVLVMPYFKGSQLNYRDTMKSLEKLTQPTQDKFNEFKSAKGRRNG